MILIAGSLPDRTFTVTRFGTKPDSETYQEVSARAYLKGRLENAAIAYHYKSDDSRRPTPTQLIKTYQDIRRLANDLLSCLQVAGQNGPSLDNMPYSLRFGALRDEAHAEAIELQAEGSGPHCMPEALLREAIQGVDRLRRWGDGARKREQLGGEPSGKANEGDAALNDFLKTVALSCWAEACDQKITIGPRLAEFVHVAAKAIDRNLGDDDAVIKRLQRLVGPNSKTAG